MIKSKFDSSRANDDSLFRLNLGGLRDLNIYPIGKSSDMSFLNKYLLDENLKEDIRMIAEYFKLVTIDELINCLLVLMTLASCFIYNETKFCNSDCAHDEDMKDDIIDLSLIFSSITSFLFILNLILKYYHYFQLYKYAKYIPYYINFFQTRLLKSFIIEFILAILHPNLLFKNKTFTTNKAYNLKEVTYSYNDMFNLIQCLRLLYLIIIFAICSDFYGPRADRICKMIGKRLNLYFSFRALFIEHTPIMLGYCSLIICSMLSYMLKILNQPLELNDTNNYKTFGNCFWYVVVTMTTVGYGDIYPETTLERLIGYLISITGTVVVALVVSFFTDQVNLEDDEKNTVRFVERVNEKEKLMDSSVTYFKLNMLYLLNKKKMENGMIPKSEVNKNKLIRLLKEKIEAKKKFKALFHRFHIKFKLESDVDKIKKKIDNLDYTQKDLSLSINKVKNKIKELMRNMNGAPNIKISNIEENGVVDNKND